MIEGRYVTLARPKPRHFEPLRAMLSDEETMRWLRFMGASWARADVEDRYRAHAEREARGTALSLVIVGNATGEVAGSCGYNLIEGDVADFGLIVHRRFWGSAVATETLLLGLEHGFGKLSLRNVDFVTLGTNVRMRALLDELELPLLEALDSTIDDIPVPGHTYRLSVGRWPTARARLEARLRRKAAP